MNKRIGFFGRQAKRLHKKLVILGSGALGFKAHAFQGTLLAGIHNVGVSGRQQFAFVRAAGAVPDVAADIIVKTPVEKSFKPVESGHPENETAHGKRQIHTSVHYGAGGKSAGIKPHFFAGRFQGFVFVLPFFIGILLGNPNVNRPAQICGLHGFNDRDSGKKLPEYSGKDAVSAVVAGLRLIGQRLGHAALPAIFPDNFCPFGKIKAELEIAFGSGNASIGVPFGIVFAVVPDPPVGDGASAKPSGSGGSGNLAGALCHGKVKTAELSVLVDGLSGREEYVGAAHFHLRFYIAGK